jgi:hypothetical protein
MSAWTDLSDELDLWAADGRQATLWWRDDDATEPSAALDRLIDLGHGTVPLALAVIPKPAVSELADRLAAEAHVTVVQHGWCHRNHRPPGEKSAEFGPDRSETAMMDDLRRGMTRLRSLFGDRFLPVFVPPWNRITTTLAPCFNELGLIGLSTFAPRKDPASWPVSLVNTHADPILWRQGKRFSGDDKALDGLVSHLSSRRLGRVDGTEPTGLLTHHLDHDADLWRFLERLFEVTSARGGARWITPAEAFAPAAERSGPGPAEHFRSE